MLTEERQRLILNEIEEKSVVYVSDLVQRLNTSESTIRRDLNSLHKEGRLNKVHGGATKINKTMHTMDDIIEKRQTLNQEEKLKVAKKAAELINENDFVYIDSGTTTELMIDFLKEKKAIYVTNGLNQAMKLISRGFKVYILAGEVKEATHAIIGMEAIKCLSKYNFTKGFFGTNGISLESGFTTPEIKEALIKEEGIKKTREAYILADDSKFDEISSITFGKLEDATIITSNKHNTYKEEIKEVTKVIEVN